MTRFARAKGSKASNERIPEEATPWHQMKQQLLDKYKETESGKANAKMNENRMKNYTDFLQEKEAQAVKDVKWAEFPGVAKKSARKRKQQQKIKEVVKSGIANNGLERDSGGATKKSLKKLKQKQNMKIVKNDIENDPLENDDSNDQFELLKSKIEESLVKEENVNNILLEDSINSEVDSDTPEEFSAKIKPKLRGIKKEKERTILLEETIYSDADSDMSEEVSARIQPKVPVIKKEKKRQIFPEEAITSDADSDLPEEVSSKIEPTLPVIKKKKMTKRKVLEIHGNSEQKETETEEEKGVKELITDKNQTIDDEQKNNQKDKKSGRELTETQLETKLKRRRLQREKKKQAKIQKLIEQNDDNNKGAVNESSLRKQKMSKAKHQEHVQRKPKVAQNIVINGNEIAIEYFDGFPIKKVDHDRLIKLQTQMRTKGLPHSEINRAIKLERRKAEKALAKMKKQVCYNCRQSGHNLSECPKLGDGQGIQQTLGTGICFKCGSTEHTHYQCKVVHSEQYKFAQCFICKEQGHISKQCPDNSRGLYPKGGACKICGDVTHLKKDCPKFQIQQEQHSILVKTIDSNNLEALDTEEKKVDAAKVRPNKIVKFM